MNPAPIPNQEAWSPNFWRKLPRDIASMHQRHLKLCFLFFVCVFFIGVDFFWVREHVFGVFFVGWFSGGGWTWCWKTDEICIIICFYVSYIYIYIFFLLLKDIRLEANVGSWSVLQNWFVIILVLLPCSGCSVCTGFLKWPVGWITPNLCITGGLPNGQWSYIVFFWYFWMTPDVISQLDNLKFQPAFFVEPLKYKTPTLNVAISILFQ